MSMKEIPIESLGLSNRSRNALRRSGIDTIDDLIEHSINDLRRIRNIGVKSLIEINNILKLKGYDLKIVD